MMLTTKAMKTNPTNTMKAALMALALTTAAYAGGPALLQLPVEGVTPKNSAQCEKLLEEKLGPVLANWKNGAGGDDVKMLVKDSLNLIQLRPGRDQLSLGDVEKALKGSPFSIKRDQLQYVGVVQLQIGEMKDHKKFVSKLAALDGKNLVTMTEKSKGGGLLITLRDPKYGIGVVISHQRLTSFLTENKVKLNSISWCGRFHCGAPFGARPSTAKVVSK